jgi:hypothetical protein
MSAVNHLDLESTAGGRVLVRFLLVRASRLGRLFDFWRIL